MPELNGDRQSLGALLVIVCDGINLSPDPFRSLLGPENLAKTDAEAQRRGYGWRCSAMPWAP